MSVLVRSATAAALAGAALMGSAAIAASQPPPPPNCTIADQSGILSGVSASLSGYLFTHPDVNWFLSSLRGLPPEERRAKVTAYMDTSPGVKAEMQAIRQPLTDFRARCGLPPAGGPDE